MRKEDIEATERVFERLKKNGYKINFFLPGKLMIGLFNFKNDRDEIKKLSEIISIDAKRFTILETKIFNKELLDLNIVNIGVK